MAMQRQTAYKMRIGDLLNGNIIFNGDRFSSLEIKNQKIARVNLIVNVVDKYSNESKNYHAITIDDGTGQIRVKGFSDSSFLLLPVQIGDTIKIVGWIRHFNDEIYVLPEIVLRVDPKWAYVRKLELLKEYGEYKENIQDSEQQEQEPEIIREKLEDNEAQESAKSIILRKIKENKEGIDMEKLILEIKCSMDEINDAVSELISEGEIYEPKPGHLRSLD